jgi:long-chain acyl-CoA synthetase
VPNISSRGTPADTGHQERPTALLLVSDCRRRLLLPATRTRFKPPEISYVLEHSQARMCFSEPALAPLAAEAGAGSILCELPCLEPADVALPEVDPEQPAAILYTSGTTARPKGAIHTHRTVIENSKLVALNLDSGDRTLVMTPMMHASGLVATLAAIHSSASAVLLPAFQPAAVLDAIERFRCTYTIALPAMMHAIAEEQAGKPRDVGSLRRLGAGGDSVPFSLQERVQGLFGIALHEAYGMTEAVPITGNPKNAIRQGSLGVAQIGVQVRIVDLNDRDLPDGEIGEACRAEPGKLHRVLE